MRDLPLAALRAYALIWEHRGVRAAARELGIAHSSVSRHLAQLERWLGTALVLPAGGRGALAFTAEGEALGAGALASLRELERVAGGLREARDTHSVTLSTTPSFATRWLLPRLADLESAHPRLELSILVDQRLDDPDTRAIDVAVRMGRGPWPNVRCEPLMDETFYPVMSPAAWKASQRPRRPEDLCGLRLLHDRDPHVGWTAWRDAFGPPQLDVRSGPRFTSSDLVLRAAAAGSGVALARGRLAADDLAAGTLMRPCGDLELRVENAYWLVLPNRAHRRAPVRVLLDWLRRQASKPA